MSQIEIAGGAVHVSSATVFYESTFCLAFLPTQPVLNLHTLLVPKRHVEKLCDLREEEMIDFSLSSRRIAKTLNIYAQATSTTFVIQDGSLTAQSVPHLHMHILPRVVGDFNVNDKVYDELDAFRMDGTRPNKPLMACEDLSHLALQLAACFSNESFV